VTYLVAHAAISSPVVAYGPSSMSDVDSTRTALSSPARPPARPPDPDPGWREPPESAPEAKPSTSREKSSGGWLTGESLSHFSGAGVEIGIGDHLVGQPNSKGLGRVDDVAEQDQLAGPALTDDSGQVDCRAHVR
jgi:hypothetical protein